MTFPSIVTSRYCGEAPSGDSVLFEVTFRSTDPGTTFVIGEVVKETAGSFKYGAIGGNDPGYPVTTALPERVFPGLPPLQAPSVGIGVYSDPLMMALPDNVTLPFVATSPRVAAWVLL